MGTRDKRVDAYITKSAGFAKPVLRYLRESVHKGCPGVQETMKWSFPHFDYHGIMCSMAAFKGHCAFTFWKAPLLKSAALQKVNREAMGNFGRITTIKDLPPRSSLVALVRQAAQLNEGGVKMRRAAPGSKGAVKVPTYMMKALNKNARALRTFRSFTPGAKREYVEWVAEARTQETRARRLATAVQWLSEGKQRNWKYLSKK